MAVIRVVVHGSSGRLGREIINALCREPGISVVGAVRRQVSTNSLPLPDGSGSIPLSSNVEATLTSCIPDVLVDSSTRQASMPAIRLAAKRGVNLVICTTGFTSDELAEMKELAVSNNIGIIVAPNFALGAALMIHLAQIAARYMDYADIIELHHHLKADAPSGTALATAGVIAAAKDKPFASPQKQGHRPKSRGEQVENVPIHSVRLPGLQARQEVVFGAPGQTLTIRHDIIGPECYMPGVIFAIKEAAKRREFIYGLDTLLNL